MKVPAVAILNQRIALLLAFIGLILMACNCGGVAPPQANPGGAGPQIAAGNPPEQFGELDPDKLSAQLGEAFAVSQMELITEGKDEASADADYFGRWLIVDGKVDDAVRTERRIAIKIDESDLTVQCFFEMAWEAEVSKIVSGKPASVCGRCTGKNGGNVVLKDCFFPETIPALVEAKKKKEADLLEAKDRREREEAKRLAAIEARPSRANYNKIQNGMTLAEAQEILGPGKEAAQAEGIQIVTWQRGFTIISITFENGRVQAKAIVD